MSQHDALHNDDSFQTAQDEEDEDSSLRRLDEAARQMLNLSHKKRPNEVALALDRAESFAKFLRRAQECIQGGHHLEDKAVQIEEEGWGGVPCWKCHTHTSSQERAPSVPRLDPGRAREDQGA